MLLLAVKRRFGRVLLLLQLEPVKEFTKSSCKSLSLQQNLTVGEAGVEILGLRWVCLRMLVYI